VAAPEPIAFDRQPDTYRHWRLSFDGPVATVTMAVRPDGGLQSTYELKLNTYDLDVDIELHDLVQRLRFEHPDVRAVVLTGGLEKVFCAGANIQMLAGSSHHLKVNFCKFTNETRTGIEDASRNSGQVWLAAVNGTAAGGGYELALACDEIILVDDRSSAVSLPEVPLLGVLPGTGGLTRVVDKRGVRRDRADVFATRSEGLKGDQAVEWGLVDAVAPPSRFAAVVRDRALSRAASSTRPANGVGPVLTPLVREQDGDRTRYPHVEVRLDRPLGVAHLTVRAPTAPLATGIGELEGAGDTFWALAACRELDDAVLRLRFNEPELGTWVLHTEGDVSAVLAVDALMRDHADHWLVREIRLFWGRTLRRLELSARSLISLIVPGSCFGGTLAELALVADRSFMLDGPSDASGPDEALLVVSDVNDGWYPMANGLSRLETRFWGSPGELAAARLWFGKDLVAGQAAELGLVTYAPDDLDFDDEVRVALEERSSFSPDALTGMEANLRFVGPETMETKIFARLSAWQNWIFQRPNAIGPEGALRRFGTGSRPTYDRTRI